MPEVTWICELLTNSIGCEDSLELSITLICPAVPETWPCVNTHSSECMVHTLKQSTDTNTPKQFYFKGIDALGKISFGTFNGEML